MSGFLTTLTVIDSIFIIILVLMQRSKSGGGLGAVSGGQSEAFFGANATNVLAKLTAWCVGIFFVLVISTIIANSNSGDKSAITADDNQASAIKTEVVEKTTPVKEAIPAVTEKVAPVKKAVAPVAK